MEPAFANCSGPQTHVQADQLHLHCGSYRTRYLYGPCTLNIRIGLTIATVPEVLYPTCRSGTAAIPSAEHAAECRLAAMHAACARINGHLAEWLSVLGHARSYILCKCATSIVPADPHYRPHVLYQPRPICDGNVDRRPIVPCLQLASLGHQLGPA